VDILISFFRDTLDGWLYVVVLVVNTILIFAIIGYLGEKKTALLLEQSKQFEEINRETLKTIESNNSKEINNDENNNNPESKTIPHIPQTTKDMVIKSEPIQTISDSQNTQETVPAVLDLDDISNSSK